MVDAIKMPRAHTMLREMLSYALARLATRTLVPTQPLYAQVVPTNAH